MADTMEFPNTMKEFIDIFSFKDSEEIYTNGAELIPVFRVEQGLEHYAKEIRAKAIDEFVKEIEAEYDNDGCPNVTDYLDYKISIRDLHKIAEQLKEGAE